MDIRWAGLQTCAGRPRPANGAIRYDFRLIQESALIRRSQRQGNQRGVTACVIVFFIAPLPGRSHYDQW